MFLDDIVGPMSVKEAQDKVKQSQKPGHKPGWALDPKTKAELKRRQDVQQRRGVDEDSWHGGDNSWSSENNEVSSGSNAWASEGVEEHIAMAGLDSGTESPIHGGMNEQRLSVGDPVIVTAPNAYEGKTGEIAEFSPSGKFVIVRLYNGGEHSMHLSDVEYNQYADDEDADEYGEYEHDDFNAIEEAGSPQQQAAIAIAKKKELDENSVRSQIGKIELLDYYITDDTYRIIAGPFESRSEGHAAFEKLVQQRQDIHFWQGRALIVKLAEMNEEELDEFAPGGTMKPPVAPTKKGDPFEDDNRSQILKSIQQLLDKGAKVDSYLFGARGHIDSVTDDFYGFRFKRKGRPGGAIRPMDGTDDDEYMLKMVKPGYYQLWDKSIADAGEQGVKEGDDFGDLDAVVFGGIDKEKQRMADLKKRDPEAYAREMAREKSRNRIPPVSTFEEQGVAEVKQRLDAKCWAGKHKEGTKIKGGVRVNNCVPNESVTESYWTKLQNEKNTRLNSLVDELSESVKKIK